MNLVEHTDKYLDINDYIPSDSRQVLIACLDITTHEIKYTCGFYHHNIKMWIVDHTYFSINLKWIDIPKLNDI